MSVARGQAMLGGSIPVFLKGQSSGGVLSLASLQPNTPSPYVVVTNQPGDKAETILKRLASQLATAEATFGGNPVSSVADNILWLSGPDVWMLGGTDAGFNIPPPVTSLSASWVEEGRKVILRWTNPPGGYDLIKVISGWDAVGRGRAGLPGNATEIVLQKHDTAPLVWSLDVSATVVGFTMVDVTPSNGEQIRIVKDITPSNGARIRLLNHVKQESLMDNPFTQGLAPGFQAWTDGASGRSLRVEQGELSGVAPGTGAGRGQPKGFYQVVRGKGTFRGGVSRTFLGLTAGHAYRASARLDTLQAKEGEWSWSFHAAPNPPGGNSLTPEQLSGIAELPDHTKGPAAGQIASYDFASATKAEWIMRSSGAEGPGKSVGDITLPEGCDSITLWFRLTGTNVTDTAVGLDSVALEDLGRQ